MLCSVLFLSIYPLKIHKLFLLKFDFLGGISATLIYLRIKGTFNDMSYTKILFISSIISLTLPFFLSYSLLVSMKHLFLLQNNNNKYLYHLLSSLLKAKPYIYIILFPPNHQHIEQIRNRSQSLFNKETEKKRLSYPK